MARFRTKFSPVIWRIYIEFEIRVGALHLAKKLLFRAIGECPLVKGKSKQMSEINTNQIKQNCIYWPLDLFGVYFKSTN